MKTLLKISCVLAIALFVSMSVNAQTLTSQEKTGALTVDVPAFMTFTVSDIADFVKPHASSDVLAVNEQDNTVVISSNVKWAFSIKANANVLSGTNTTETIPLSAFSFSIPASDNAILSTTPVTFTGSKDATMTLSWQFSPGTTNYFADEYTVGLTYTLAQTAF